MVHDCVRRDAPFRTRLEDNGQTYGQDAELLRSV